MDALAKRSGNDGFHQEPPYAEREQHLLAIAISAAVIRTQLEQPMCADERARLAAEPEYIELVRRMLEQHFTASERSQRPCWRHLLRV